MTFEEFVAYLTAHSVGMSLRDGQLRLQASDEVLTPEIKELVEKHQRRLVSYLRRQETPSAAENEGQPLSWFQERLWVHHRRDPEGLGYNIPVVLEVKGALDVAALAKSLGTIVARQESLRTTYRTSSDGFPIQVITPPGRFDLPIVEVDEDSVNAQVGEVAEHRFDLETGPVFIARLLKVDDERHVLALNVHHIAADAWSIKGVLFNELQRCYQAYCAGHEPQLPPLRMQYKEFATWQRKRSVSGALEYWQQLLSGYQDTLELPADHLRHPQSGQRSEEFVYRYSEEFALGLERFSRAQGCTVFMSLLAALGLVVSRYTGRADLCIGTTSSGRSRVELEPLIGFFVNILPLRFEVDEETTVAQYMKKIRGLALAGFEHQMVPFEQILHAGGFSQQTKANPLVPVVVRHQNFPHTSVRHPLSGGVTFEPYQGAAPEKSTGADKQSAARCELELSYTGTGSELSLDVAYASDLYERETIERLLAQHEHVLIQMFQDEGRLLRELDPLREVDRKRLCSTLNATDRSLDGKTPFPQRFREQAERTPEAVCCTDDSGSLSFGQIEARSNQIAHHLLQTGVCVGDVVGVCLRRGADALITLLGIWKAGAAYVPLDPSYPEAYLRQILSDAEPVRIFTTSSLVKQLALDAGQCTALDEATAVLEAAPAVAPKANVGPESLAYIMYTSGSTGVPKGVRVPHRQLINWQSGIEQRWPFEPSERIAQKTTMAFAVSVKELFAGLLNGCSLVFLDDAVVRDAAALTRALADYQISRMNLVPSHLATVLAYLEQHDLELPALRTLITAGEPLTSEVVRACRARLPRVRLLNNYGCTELNDITYYDTSAYQGTEGFVPIGRPIQNTQLYVLDREGRLVPEGVAGELHVASAGMSEGYHRLDALTEERYVSQRFGDEPSRRCFNTGDVVRYLPDGNLDYIGRWDLQVKVRGFRVDVRHVEKVLGDYPGIGLRAVIGQGDRLVAFYLADTTVDLSELREFLRHRLPSYMVPDAFVLLEAMPRLPNGKLDRRALRASDAQLQQTKAYAAPATKSEEALAEIWASVLEQTVDGIGRATHFFELGGHSLAATRVVSRIKDGFGVDVVLSEVFERPTLSELAEHVDELCAARPDDYCEWSVPVEESAPELDMASQVVSGKVAVVTGASRGIGRAIAVLLARNGAQVVINYRDSERAAREVKAQIEAFGGTAEVVQADVTCKDQVQKMVEQVHATFGPVDILVANASIGFSKRPFVESEWGDVEQKVSAELKAVYHPCRAFVGDMLDRQNGSIIAISSTLSKHTNPGFVAQSTAKAALDAFVRSLATELGSEGVRVNTVAPGVTLTDGAVNMSQQHKDATAAMSPLNRNGTPDDMAGVVLFLASDLSRFMTGAYLPVDGGFTML